jgi:hypothetical protein
MRILMACLISNSTSVLSPAVIVDGRTSNLRIPTLGGNDGLGEGGGRSGTGVDVGVGVAVANGVGVAVGVGVNRVGDGLKLTDGIGVGGGLKLTDGIGVGDGLKLTDALGLGDAGTVVGDGIKDGLCKGETVGDGLTFASVVPGIGVIFALAFWLPFCGKFAFESLLVLMLTLVFAFTLVPKTGWKADASVG